MSWVKKNMIILILSQMLIQKTSHLFKSHQKDKDYFFVQSKWNSIERELLQKVFSD